MDTHVPGAVSQAAAPGGLGGQDAAPRGGEFGERLETRCLPRGPAPNPGISSLPAHALLLSETPAAPP